LKKFILFALPLLACVFVINLPGFRHPGFDRNSTSPLLPSARTGDSKAGVQNKGMIMARAAAIAVPFVRNVGQFAGEVTFAADLFSGRFFLTDKELVYSLLKRSNKKRVKPTDNPRFSEPQEGTSAKGFSFREYFVDRKGAKIEFNSTGEQKAPTTVSYFKGKDAGKWHSGVASYQNVSLGKVFPGIEVKLKASGKNVEKVFYVAPQAEASEIMIGVEGVAGLKMDRDGRLIFKNPLGDLAMRTPVAWQEIDGQRHEVKVGYRLLAGRMYGFVVLHGYDARYPLVIDPELDTLLASTFLGGGGSPAYFDWGYSLALDKSGNVYLTGTTNSPDFPTTRDAYARTITYSQAFVSKLNSDLTDLLASTFFGGDNSEEGMSLALDSSGNVFIAGYTYSVDFPATPGAYKQSYAGGRDGFISKLNGDLTTLLASTLLGGSNEDYFTALRLDNSENVYLTGYTRSPEFPTTPGAFDRSTDTLHDVFIAKLNSDLTVLLAATFLGTRVDDFEHAGNCAWSLALDNSGNVYVTGKTDMVDFPTTRGAFDPTYNGFRHYRSGKWPRYYFDSDVFISKLDGNLTTLKASTYLGASNPDHFSSYYGNIDNETGYSLALDNSGNVCLTGETSSSNFPVTAGAYDPTFNSDDDHCDSFVAKFNNNLSSLLASSYLGGHEDDHANSIVLDSLGNVYVSGYTMSNDFPITPWAYDGVNLSYDVFISKFDGGLTKLLASTFLGGSDGNEGHSLALDDSGNIYLAGNTSSSDFPTTPEAYDQSYYREPYGNSTAFISKLNGSGPMVKIELQAERLNARSYNIMRSYGKIQFTVNSHKIPVARFTIWRSRNNGNFALLATVTPAELDGDHFDMLDKYLDNGIQYTYLVDAYDSAGRMVGRSAEKTI
jgi:hypothetical protein